MKLINKKTGEIAEIKLKLNESLPDGIRRTIEEAGWEETREPLIKDEKIRKVVRAWAEANDFINGIKVEGLNAGTRFSEGHWSIEFIGYFIYDLKIDSIYTIAELCGEEEE